MENKKEVELITKEEAVELTTKFLTNSMIKIIDEVNTKICNNIDGKVYHCFKFMTRIEKEALELLLKKAGYTYKITGDCFVIDYSEDCINKFKVSIEKEEVKKEWGEL